MPLIINRHNQVIATKRHGMPVYVVVFRGVKAGEFLSIAAANSKLIILNSKV